MATGTDGHGGGYRAKPAGKQQQGVTYYDLLRLKRSASPEEVRAAYLVRAKRFHPDRNPAVSRDLAERLAAAMAEINDAYDVLKDPERRAAYDRDLERSESITDLRVPSEQECSLCGASPARSLRFEHQNAWLLGATTYGVESVLCRSCGLAVGRSKQSRTALTGWWGVLAFFRNLAVLVRNAANLWQAGRLDTPRSTDPRVVAPLSQPLDQGRVVWLRGGTIAVACVLAVSLIAAATGGSSDARDATPQGMGNGFDSGWRIGSCVEGDTWVTPTPCSEPNDGKIVDRVAEPRDCAMYAESYVEDGSDVWCIDDS